MNHDEICLDGCHVSDSTLFARSLHRSTVGDGALRFFVAAVTREPHVTDLRRRSIPIRSKRMNYRIFRGTFSHKKDL